MLLARCLCSFALISAFAPQGFAWSPGSSNPNAVDGLSVNASNREDVLSFWHCIYQASEGYESRLNWTGSLASCTPGTTAAVFKDDVRRRINWYRAMVGLPGDISFTAAKSADAQAAALIMHERNDLSHDPLTDFGTGGCWSASGQSGASQGNLALGSYGPESVNGYMEDPGTGNEVVGHRRWLLYSRAQQMGTGDIPASAGHSAANSVFVFGNFKPAPTPQFVAWPNAGYIPGPVLPGRWSLSYPGADFVSAAVSMTNLSNSSAIPNNIINSNSPGYGDNTIVWEPNWSSFPGGTAPMETPIQVTVSGITGAGIPSSSTYIVRVIDPNALGYNLSLSGPATPLTSGGLYNLTTSTQATAYEVSVAQSQAISWPEGAEDSPVPNILDQTTYSPLRVTSLVRTGGKSFHLAMPSFANPQQSFEVAMDLVPTASSSLEFYERMRWATTTCALSAEISEDGGGTWTSVWSRNGNHAGGSASSSLWDTVWNPHSISLASYDGKVVRIRFCYRLLGGSAFIDTGSNFGFFIDDIQLTNSSKLQPLQVNALPANATTFSLNSSTAGGALVAGNTYFLRQRINLGCKWFGFGPKFTVTPSLTQNYSSWILANYPTATGGTNGDDDLDGIVNGLEYAFNGQPTNSADSGNLPEVQRSDSTYTINFAQPSFVTGVTYIVEHSADLSAGSWLPLSNSATPPNYSYTFNDTDAREFFRFRAVVAP